MILDDMVGSDKNTRGKSQTGHPVGRNETSRLGDADQSGLSLRKGADR